MLVSLQFNKTAYGKHAELRQPFKAEMKLIHALLILMIYFDPAMAGLCKEAPNLCSECRKKAICKTSSVENVIPVNLSSELTEMSIHYVGHLAEANVSLGPTHFQNYLQLVNITLQGRGIVALEPHVFQQLNKLERLVIQWTSISVLPEYILPVNSRIVKLDLYENLLQEIPRHLFHDLSNLTKLNLGFNNIVLRNCTTFPEEFENLTSLTYLHLDNITVSEECEEKIPGNYFKPIQKSVKLLNLTQTNFYGNNQTIFEDFNSLEHLDISLAKGFIGCPAKAAVLFEHLPTTLRKLAFRRWRINLSVNSSCIFTNETMATLKSRLQLYKLDLKYSDWIFGSELKENMFKGFNNLSELNLGWARFSSVENYVFNGCPNLSFVTMDGNPVGRQPLRLFQNRSFSKLTRLKVKRAQISSDFGYNYDASPLLLDSPIKELDLKRNYLSIMPLFANESNTDLERLFLDFNFLTSLEKGQSLGIQCQYLKNLKKLTVSNNKLEYVAGLCPSITSLDLSYNNLDVYWHTINSQAISKLENLEHLYLVRNRLTTLSPDLFKKMKNLTRVVLTSNNLTTIDNSMFPDKAPLKILDLRENSFAAFNVKCIQHLRKLEELLLQDNGITNVNKGLVDYLKNSNSVTKFGLTGNPLICDCDQDEFHDWIQTTDIVPSANELTCSKATEKSVNILLYEYKKDTYRCEYQKTVEILLSVLGGIVGAVIIAVPCYKYRWYLAHIGVVFRAILSQLSAVQLEHQCVYSAYVMYNSTSDSDLDWIIDRLLPAVEKEPDSDEESLKLYVCDRDSLPGSNIHTEMVTAMEKSRKIILVLSNSYLKQPSCRSQADLAGRELYGRKFYQPNRLLVLIIDELDEDSITAPFNSLLTENVIDMRNLSQGSTKRAWKRVRRFIAKPVYYYAKKSSQKTKASVYRESPI